MENRLLYEQLEDEMRYAIYGAGKRGQEELEALGKENVIAFIDKDENKIGTDCCHVPVIGLEKFAEYSGNALCVISPANGHEDIIRELKDNKIENYIEIAAFDRMLYYCRQEIFDNVLRHCDDLRIGIYGISAGTIVLCDFLSSRTSAEIILFPSLYEDKQKYQYLYSNYNVMDLKDAGRQVSVIINTDWQSDVSLETVLEVKVQIINAQTLFEESVPFKNEKIGQYRDVHKKQRCFIVATGPSLTIDDLNTLHEHGETCISMNRVYNIFERTVWRPDYYVIEDIKMIEDLREEIANLELPVKFVSSMPESYWLQENSETSIKYQLALLNVDQAPPLFSTHADKCVYAGSTVTYICMQMAVYMGFQEIYLLGVDFNYSKDLYHQRNHFEGYDKDKEIRLNDVYPEKMEQAYESAKRFADSHGIYIYNATRGGKLEVFERVDFDSLF